MRLTASIRRIRLAWALVLVFAGVLGFGPCSAAAQTYFDFTFSGGGYSLSSIIAASGSAGDYTATAITGTLNGNALSLVPAGFYSNMFTYPNSVSGEGYFDPFNSNNPCGADVSCYISFSADGQAYDFASFSTTEGYVAPDCSGQCGAYVTYSLTEHTPAPLPGSGLLSYLVLGFAGLCFRGKLLWRRVRIAVGRSSSGASTAPFFAKSD